MSVTFNLICHECKRSIWIGQSSRTFYSGESHTMECLKEFLFDHIGHHLSFDAPEYHEEMMEKEWTEVDTKPPYQ